MRIKYEKFSTRVTQVSRDIYGDMWKVGIGKTYKVYDDLTNSKKVTKEYLVFDKTSLNSGMDAITLVDEKTGEVRIIYQGSTPGLPSRVSDPENWDRDWSNNLFGNTPKLANNLIGLVNAKNTVASSMKGIGNSIMNNSVIKTTEYNQFPSNIIATFGKYKEKLFFDRKDMNDDDYDDFKL